MDDLLTVLDSPDLIPTRAHAGDAGADLRAAEDAILYHGEVRVIRTGVKLVIPYQYAGLVRGRSSLTKNGIIHDGRVDDMEHHNGAWRMKCRAVRD